ncbi:tyrosine--tRNA ligase [Candidatus Gottesmanbacteria bacterium]|nr:tyrosine--tRNA ligase [Candidatus Gottesmanbacteria bacterium]
MDSTDTLLNRGVDKVYPSREALEKVLKSGKKLKLYQGFDPTGINLHIGHMVGLMKLRQFQKAGHEVIFLIGDGTGQAGDPSGKTRSRDKYLTNEQLRKNAKDYVMQAKRIVDFDGPNGVRIMYNGDWLNKLTLSEVLNIAGHFTAQQMNERDLFQERYKNNIPLNLREFMYPLLQGYDSVVMDVDMEIGGSDQTFNMLAGRQLMKAMKGKDKFVLSTVLISDKFGKKIGKTEGNAISLTDKPEDLYGKIMSFPDEVIVQCLECLTEIPMEDINVIADKIKNGDNPMKFKKLLAFEVVKLLNSEKDAQAAQAFFEQAHQQGSTTDLKNAQVVSGNGELLKDVIIKNLGLSISAIKQLVYQKAIDVNGLAVNDVKMKLKTEDMVRVGKKHIFKIK